MAKEYKKLLIEKKGVTIEKEPETLKLSVDNSSVYDKDGHKQSEEVGYALVEGSPYFRLLEEAEAIEGLSAMSYPEKFEALLKVFGVDKISELSDDKKKEFFNTLDEIHVSEKEKNEVSVPATDSEITVSESSVVVSFPASKLAENVDGDMLEALRESLRIIHSTLAGKRLNEEETVEVPVDTEADIKFEGDKIVIELPVESPKQEVSEEEAEKINEAVSVARIVLDEGFWDEVKKFGGHLGRNWLPWTIAGLGLTDAGRAIFGSNPEVPGQVGQYVQDAYNAAQTNAPLLTNIAPWLLGAKTAEMGVQLVKDKFLGGDNYDKAIKNLTPQERLDFGKITDTKGQQAFLDNLIASKPKPKGTSIKPKITQRPIEQALSKNQEIVAQSQEAAKGSSSNSAVTPATGGGTKPTSKKKNVAVSQTNAVANPPQAQAPTFSKEEEEYIDQLVGLKGQGK
jgi:hypothetical protein